MVILFVTRYGMPFRLDDVILIEWSQAHPWWHAFMPIDGELVNSLRPIFALTSWTLSHTAGTANPFVWHLTLVSCLMIALAYIGRVARYLSGNWEALQFSTALYWLAFTSILNVFFWFSDLTYALELVLVAPAWYYGLRGLREADPRSWRLAMLISSLAVLAKEPSMVLLHAVFLGSLFVDRGAILAAWQKRSKSERAMAVGYYAVFCLACLFIVLNTPTKSNRFFAIGATSSALLRAFVEDRVGFYGAILFSPLNRILLFTPIIYALATALPVPKTLASIARIALRLVASVLIALVFTSGVIGGIATILLLAGAVLLWSGPEDRPARSMLPFLLTAIFATVVLLLTIQLVKTQLTEIAFLLLVVAGWAWSVLGRDIASIAAPFFRGRRTLAIGLGVLLLLLAIGGIEPKLARQEHLLREVRSVRTNANDAIQWASKHLPKDAILAVSGYPLHGIRSGDDLTSKADETKIRSQYTFAEGFVYVYLKVLGRTDIRGAYLEDTVMLPRVLKGMREMGGCYVFVQTELDRSLFHGVQTIFHGGQSIDTLTSKAPLRRSDSLVVRFEQSGMASEIWLLRDPSRVP